MNNDDLKFEVDYPQITPSDWKDKDNPTTYEIMATLDTLKKLSDETVHDLNNKQIDKEYG